MMNKIENKPSLVRVAFTGVLVATAITAAACACSACADAESSGSEAATESSDS